MKPNILVLMTDEQNVFMSSMYDHSFVQTPNMQRLADRGVTFDAAYCNSPTCVPSRASFMTGQYPHQVEVYDLSSSLSSSQPTWAHLFNAAGYETALCGKMHFIGPDQRHGFSRRLVEDCHGDGRNEGVPNWDAMPKRGSPEKRILRAGRAGRNRWHEYDYRVRNETVKYLREHAAYGSERPFALCTSFISPHFPLVVEEEYFDLYYPDLADLPRHDEPVGHPMYERIRHKFGVDRPLDPEAVRRCRAAYYGLITFVDDLIGDVLDALEETGLADDTAIILTSDHGEMLGERGMWWKSSFLEHAARVPMVCAFPNVVPEGERRSEVVSLIDMAPTMLEMAGIEIPPFFEGSSILPLLRGESGGWKDEAMVEYLAHGAIHPQAALRKGEYKLHYALYEPPLLYNLSDDPYELNNLAAFPRYRDLVRELERDLLARWPAEALDRRVRASQARRRYVRAGRTDTVAAE